MIYSNRQFNNGGKQILEMPAATPELFASGVALAGQPQASLPNQTSSWAELKAAYRLLNQPDVTKAALSAPNWQTTRRQAAQLGLNVVLFIQDTTELDFTAHRQTRGLGHIGDTNGRGNEIAQLSGCHPHTEKARNCGRGSTNGMDTRARVVSQKW